MKSKTYLITVSIDEFTCLHDSGCLRVDWNRLTPGTIACPSSEVVTSVLMRLPEFLERDEHNILVLFFEITHGAEANAQSPFKRPDFRPALRAVDCRQVIPLTSHAKSILESRFAGRVILAEPVFEKAFEEDFHFRHQERSLAGGDALICSLVDAQDYRVPQQFQEQALQSFMNENSLMSKLLNYQRDERKGQMTREPISGLRDLGRMLTDMCPDRKPTAELMRLGDWLKPRSEKDKGFRSVYMDRALDQILTILTDCFLLPTHAASLGIFLHWRELALRASGLDLAALETDCRELSGCVPGEQIVDAIWLLGFSAGFETFASAYYSRLDKAHPFGGGRTVGEKVELLWSKSGVQASIASESQVLPLPKEIQQSSTRPAEDLSKMDTKPPTLPAEVSFAPEVPVAVEINESADQSAEQSSIKIESGIIKTEQDAPPETVPIRPPGPAKKVAKKAPKKTTGSKIGRKSKDSHTPEGGELFDE